MKLYIGDKSSKKNLSKEYTHIKVESAEDISVILKLPFDNESVDHIYACHILHYFSKEEALAILKEWKRVVKKGNSIRVCVPDFWRLTTIYPNSIKVSDIERHIELSKCKSIHDFLSLQCILVSAGFYAVKRYDSMLEDKSNNLIGYANVSLNVEAYR